LAAVCLCSGTVPPVRVGSNKLGIILLKFANFELDYFETCKLVMNLNLAIANLSSTPQLHEEWDPLLYIG
ncbi:hypothetical protein ACJX0J_015685, partial [Zea mays]